jgi:16S rRNA (guanine1207-N2)-methyltransferase
MSRALADPAAEVLGLPFAEDQLPRPARALFLRARAASWLRELGDGLICTQSFRPHALALQAAGLKLGDAPAGRFPCVLLLPPRQREESRALLAQALDHLEPGGRLLLAQAKDEGARSAQADLQALAGPVQVLSKHHCRVCWSEPFDPSAACPLQAGWRTLDAPRRVADGRYLSRPGVFAWDRIDPASALLAECFTPELAGRAADLGCGWGYLSDQLLSRCPDITALDGFEAERRALELALENLAPHASRVALGLHWRDVREGLPAVYDLIISNPPFHQGRAAEPALGQAFIAAAADALRPGGRLLLVANAHLPYEAGLRARFATVRVLRVERGFKVFEARR